MELSLNAIKAVSYAMAKKDVRYYFCAMLLEVDESTNYRLVTTDGYRIHIVNKGLTKVTRSYLIPRSTIETLLKTTPKNCEAVSFKEETDKTGMFTFAGNSVTFTYVDGCFPDYRKVIPVALKTPSPSVYLADYIKDGVKAVQDYEDNKRIDTLKIVQQGKDMGVAIYGDLFIGVMPKHFSEDYCNDVNLSLDKFKQGV